ncbi:MAG: hypothetical protein JWQ49_5114, partial [Edaphobacter sp.]|nr:hypothetical protein [Edaphobacter sp.]
MEPLSDFHIITGRSVRSALRDLLDAGLRGLAYLKSSAQQNMGS